MYLSKALHWALKVFTHCQNSIFVQLKKITPPENGKDEPRRRIIFNAHGKFSTKRPQGSNVTQPVPSLFPIRSERGHIYIHLFPTALS